MKHSIATCAVLLSVLLLATLAPRGDARASASQDDLEKRIAELEQTVAGLQQQNLDAARRLDSVQRYLQRQADGSKAMRGALDRVESLGFTKGINYESREALLGAMRDFGAVLEKDVPGLPSPAPAEGTARR